MRVYEFENPSPENMEKGVSTLPKVAWIPTKGPYQNDLYHMAPCQLRTR